MARASARSRLHETSTRRRLLTLFAAWVIVCLAGAGAVALALAAADTARNDVSELDRVERDVAALAKSYVDQETGVRGYLLGGTDALLDPYHAGQTTSARLIAEIRKEVHSDALRTTLDRVEQAARAWRTRIAEPDIALRRSGQATEAQLAESTGPGKQRFDALRTQLAKLTAAANAADAARNDHERNLQRWALAATVATIAAAIAGAVVIWILIGRWITAPLETLAGAVREAGAHPDAGAMPAAGGTPEIRTLATEVDEMRRNIAHQGVELALTRNESEERRRIIDELQRALLPAQRARIAGAQIAARYLTSSAGANVGGDWYATIPLGDDRLGIAIGDVVGHGLTAVADMASSRFTLRGFASEGRDPATVLYDVNRALQRFTGAAFSTACYGVIDVSRREFSFALAGHLPPALLRADGSAEFLDAPPGPPLGAFPEATYELVTVSIDAGATIVLYTDGLIERRDQDLTERGNALLEVLRGTRSDAESVCDTLLAGFASEPTLDDIALIAVTLPPDRDPPDRDSATS